MSFSFSSCSESDPNSPTNETTEVNLEKVTQQYVNDVVFVTYSKLADQSEQLFNKLEALRAKLNAGQTVNQSEIDALCDNYKEARKIWEASEAFLYGAADEKNIDLHIDTWPLDVETLSKDLEKDEKINKLNKTYDLVTVRKEITDKNLGFHGIEFVLFRNGKNRPASFFNNNTTEDYEFFTGKNVTAKEEVIYAYNVAGDLRDKCYQLEVAWLGDKAKSEHIARINECAKLMDDFGTRTAKGLFYGQDLLLAGSKDSQHATWQKVMETILEKGCSNICGEVADQKIKKSGDEISIKLIKNPDIISDVGHLKTHRPFTVGFAAETQNVDDYAKDKLERKNLDMICANDVSGGQVFNADENALQLFWKDGHKKLSLKSKVELAADLVNEIIERYQKTL